MVDGRWTIFFISFFFLSLFFEDVGDPRDLDADALIAKQMGSDESRMMDYKWVEGGNTRRGLNSQEFCPCIIRILVRNATN